ncbi:MAG: hypothetical protein H6625_08450 [Bdellovibrionaceae bacterium]|nr:hypothetical protein [Pseudobdellovibrionaceae bacterium]
MKSLIYQTISVCAILIATLIATQAQSETQTTQAPLNIEKSKYLSTYNLMHRTFEGRAKSNYAYQVDSLAVTTHNFGLGYYIAPSYILGVSGKFIRTNVNLKSSLNIPGMPSQINSSTEGLGDTMIGLTKEWSLKDNALFLLSANISLPTGSYQEKTPTGKLISYRGQLGSGTYDLAPYMLYRRRWSRWDLMTRIHGHVRTGRNDLEYRNGDDIMLIASTGFWLNKYIALTGGLYYKNWREVVGSENVLAFNNKVSAARYAKLASANTGHPTSSTSPHPTQHGPQTRSGGSPHSSSSYSAYSNVKTEDIFAASGATYAANIGIKSGIYLGPILKGSIEAGIPIYNDQVGPLQGLNTSWYLVTSLVSNF